MRVFPTLPLRVMSMKLLIILIISSVYCGEIRAESTTFQTTPVGPCPGYSCEGGLWVDQGGPCWECIYYDTCEMFGCSEEETFCFLYNTSFPLNQYGVDGECRKNPCMGEPLLDGGRLTYVCDGAQKCPNGYACVESVCCESLRSTTETVSSTAAC